MAISDYNVDAKRIDEDIKKLRQNRLVLPNHPYRAMKSYGDAVEVTNEMRHAAGRDLDNLSVHLGKRITSDNYDDPEVQKIVQHNDAMTKAMGDKRIAYRRMTKEAGGPGPGSPIGGDAYNAIPRFYDPLEYWDLAGLPWNVADEGHRHKLHKWMRLYYATHYLVPILIDIFTRFPLVGMELECKDPALKEIYEDIFFDNLDYEEFLVALGREFWLCGEAYPLGSFDEDLGVWEHEELINPEDVVIDNFPLLNSQQLKIVPPDYLRRIAQTKSPAREWYMLKENYEDLIPYLLKGEHIPISPVMLRQVANKLNHWDDHGTPILLRGLRTLLHEEKLLASQDAIAERLYSPFILAKLGIMDMGDGLPPWLPGPAELESVRDDLDIALSSDFRVMVHHFGLELTSVFGREQMPRLGDDFDRIERRLMQVFGVNPSLLSAGSNAQPYASSALQAEFMNQILRTFQKMLKNHYRERALIVAEARGHQDYETRGSTRIPIFEKIVIFNEDGEKEIKRVPKLLIPDLKFATFDLRDEATERQFLQTLRTMGVPIPDEDLMIGIDKDYREMDKQYNKELEIKTIAQQEAKMKAYIALTVKGLPVPLDLKAEVESVLLNGPGAGGGAPQGMGGAGGQPSPMSPPGPSQGPQGQSAPGGIVMPPPPAGIGGGPGTVPPGGGAPPTSPTQGGPAGNVPQVSNERRPGLKYNTHTAKDVEWAAPFMDDEEIDDKMANRLAQVYDEYPDTVKKFIQKVASDNSVESDNPSDPAILLGEVDDFTLTDSQQLVKNAGDDQLENFTGEEYIFEASKSKTPVKIATPEAKRYSIIDPLYTPPEEKDEQESESESEPT